MSVDQVQRLISITVKVADVQVLCKHQLMNRYSCFS